MRGGATKMPGEDGGLRMEDGTEQPRSQHLIEILRESHRQSALKGEIRASCIVYDIRTTPPGREDKQDAIAIEIDHRDSYSVVVVFPYTLAANNVLDVVAPFAISRHNTTFVADSNGLIASDWKITSEYLTSSQISGE